MNKKTETDAKQVAADETKSVDSAPPVPAAGAKNDAKDERSASTSDARSEMKKTDAPASTGKVASAKQDKTAKPADNSSAVKSEAKAHTNSQANKPAPAKASSKASVFWILLALVALGLAGWQWTETRQRLVGVQEELANRLAAQDRALADARTQVTQAAESSEAAKARIAVTESKLAEFETKYAVLDAQYQELARGRDEGVLSEVEQLIGIAAQQLQLAGNVSAALLALTQADTKLARVDRSQLLPLRRIIDRDVSRLRNLPDVDLSAVSVKIESVLVAVDAFEPAFVARPSDAQRVVAADSEAVDYTTWKGWRKLFAGVWYELRGLVRIQRFDRVEPNLVSPSQEFFLRENLKLRLLSARLALLARDGVSFRNEIKQSYAWVQRHFDTRNQVGAQASATLQQLAALEITAVQLPSLDEAMSAVRAIKLDRERSKR